MATYKITYEHDAARRLIRAKLATGEEARFAWDAAGNRTQPPKK